MVLAISCAFAAIVIRLAKVPNFGINLHGGAKHGKSTALLVGTSVIGINQEKDLPNWAATIASGFEIARLFNDLMMPINETALIEGAKKDSYTKIKKWIYANNEGREPTKASRSPFASNQSSTDWHGIFFATSEHSFDEFARVAKAMRDNGEYARCTDVPVLSEGYDTIFDRYDIESETKPTAVWARKELSRLRDECEANCGVAAHSFIRKLAPHWSDHPAFIEEKVNEFVAAVGGDRLTNVDHHVARNFGIIYAGACLAIKETILPWSQKVLLECIRSCFFDAMGEITNADDILKEGIAKLRDSLCESSLWPDVLEYHDEAWGFAKSIDGRTQFASYAPDFRKMIDDEIQTRMVLKWLHKQGLLKVSQSEGESLEAAIWKGTTPKWGDGKPYRSYVFFSPFETTPQNNKKQTRKIRKFR
jgi:hypothetical protein